MSGRRDQEPPSRGSPGLLARILAVPLVPFVAAWEMAVAIVHGIGPAVRWIFKVLGIALRALFTGVRIVAETLWRLVTWPFRLLGRGIAWVARQLARALLPIAARAWIIVRTLLKAFLEALRVLGERVVVPLRLLARAAYALAIRIGLLVRELARLAWLALRAIWARILPPLRFALRTFVSLVRRLFLVLRELVSVLRAARAVGRFVQAWLLVPIGRAITAVVSAAWWLLRQLGSALQRAAFVALIYLLPVGRAIWTWLLAPLGRGLMAVISAARWLLRQVGFLLRLAARTVRAAVVLALSALAWVFRPVVLAWRWATAAVAAAARVAISIVRSSLRTARVAVLLAVHDSRNLVRKALGRPALPPPDLSAPTRKRGRPAQRKPAKSRHRPESNEAAQSRHLAELDEAVWLARTAPESSRRAASPARRGWAWAGLIAIVVTLVVVLMGSMRGGNQPVTGQVIAPPQNVSDTCPVLLPGGPIATNGEAACGTLSVQHPHVVLVCAEQSRLPAPWNFVGRNASTGNVEKGPSLSFVGNSCRLESPPEQQAEISTALSAGDVVLIVDFALNGHGNFEVGLAARCSSTECVNVEADTLGSMWMAERNGSTWTNHATGTHEPFPADVNRLVMWVGANTEVGWLNGKVIDSVSVRTGMPAGDASFFVSTADNYNPAPVVVDVQQFVIASL
jgi:hypothetical protein